MIRIKEVIVVEGKDDTKQILKRLMPIPTKQMGPQFQRLTWQS